MTTRGFLAFVLCVVFALWAPLYSQQARIVPGTPFYGPGGAPLTDEEGVKFVLQPGELVVTLKVGPDGGPFTQRIRLADQVDPGVTAAVQPSESDHWRYFYDLANRLGAPDRIRLFAVGIDRPEELTNISQPPTWQQGAVSLANWGTIPRLNWWARDEGQLASGSAAGPFGFDSTWLPGLVTAYVQSNVWPPEGPRFDVELLGPSQREAFYRSLSLENNSARVVTLGPKIRTGPDVTAQEMIKAVGSELRLAARLPEFQDVQQLLMDLAGRVDSGQRSSQLFTGVGSTPLQRAFFQAMQWAVEHAARLP